MLLGPLNIVLIIIFITLF